MESMSKISPEGEEKRLSADDIKNKELQRHVSEEVKKDIAEHEKKEKENLERSKEMQRKIEQDADKAPQNS